MFSFIDTAKYFIENHRNVIRQGKINKTYS